MKRTRQPVWHAPGSATSWTEPRDRCPHKSQGGMNMHDTIHSYTGWCSFKYQATKTYASEGVLNLGLDVWQFHAPTICTIYWPLTAKNCSSGGEEKKSVCESNPGPPVRCLIELSRLLIHTWVNKSRYGIQVWSRNFSPKTQSWLPPQHLTQL